MTPIQANKNEDNKKLVQELKSDETAMTFSAAGTLLITIIMMADAAIKASLYAIPSLPELAIMYLAFLLLIFSGAMTLSYCARQHTVMKIQAALEAKDVVTIEATAEEGSRAPVTA